MSAGEFLPTRAGRSGWTPRKKLQNNSARRQLHEQGWLLTVLICWVGSLLFWGTAQGAPFSNLHVTFTQPDGTPIEVIGWGDDFHAVFETAEGYTVLFDPLLKAYCFARETPGGNLVSTGAQVHRAAPAALGLGKHARMSAQARRQQAQARWQRWDQAMEIEQRWKERKASLHQFEPASSGTGVVAALQPNSVRSTTLGTKVGLCLLIDFDDDPATVPQGEIANFCNGDSYTGFSNNGSVKKYFRDNSNGLLIYSNVVTVYVRIPNSLHPKSYYNDTTKACAPQANLLIRDALAILKGLTNYTSDILPAFNNLTVDSNNRVIACNVFYAGGNGGVWSYGLWPHSSSLSSVGAQELSAGGKKLYRYQATNIGSSLAIGTFCHENGHMLCGYPDIYDYGYDSKGGAGQFCLMNSGNGLSSGHNPAQICAYLKRASGWATTIELNSNSVLTAKLTATAGTNFNHFYRYQKPGVATEYFLVECRYKTGRDANLPASGIALWHIDELGNRDNQSLTPNTTHANYEVTLVQADNLWHFQNNVNSGDSRDLYYSGNTAAGYLNRFSDLSSPNAHWWSGANSGVSFSGFTAAGSTMTFIVGKPPTIVAQPQSQGVLVGQKAAFSVSASGATPLSYQWRFNGANLLGATASTYLLNSAQAANAGAYSVLVANVAGSLLSSSAVLNVYPPPALSAAGYSTNRTFRFTVAGAPGLVFVIEASANFTNWIPIATNTSPFTFVDTDAQRFPFRVYRARH